MRGRMGQVFFFFFSVGDVVFNVFFLRMGLIFGQREGLNEISGSP